jgi:hypothetical protein
MINARHLLVARFGTATSRRGDVKNAAVAYAEAGHRRAANRCCVSIEAAVSETPDISWKRH